MGRPSTLRRAPLCLPDKSWGAVGADLAANPIATIPDPDVCSVCYEDFDEMLPAAQGTTPTAAGRFDCPHSLCRACDLVIHPERTQPTLPHMPPASNGLAM